MHRLKQATVEVRCPGLSGDWAVAAEYRRLPFFRREQFYRCSACGAKVGTSGHVVLRAH